MKLKKMQKAYCPECKNKIKCELGDVVNKNSWHSRTMKQEIKWYGSGAWDSESKLYSLENDIESRDFICPVIAEIMKERFRIKIDNLADQIERLERHKNKLKRHIDKCNSMIPKKEEVSVSA